MLIKFTTSLVGHLVIKPGDVVEISESEAQRHLKARNAVPANAVETAVFRAREKALAEETQRQEESIRKAAEDRKKKPVETR